MTKLKHTPGPWKVDPKYNGDIQAANGKDVATCGIPNGISENEARMNIKLICAAPEMLEERINHYDGEDSNGNIILRIPKDKFISTTEKATGLSIEEVLAE